MKIVGRMPTPTHTTWTATSTGCQSSVFAMLRFTESTSCLGVTMSELKKVSIHLGLSCQATLLATSEPLPITCRRPMASFDCKGVLLRSTPTPLNTRRMRIGRKRINGRLWRRRWSRAGRSARTKAATLARSSRTPTTYSRRHWSL